MKKIISTQYVSAEIQEISFDFFRTQATLSDISTLTFSNEPLRKGELLAIYLGGFPHQLQNQILSDALKITPNDHQLTLLLQEINTGILSEYTLLEQYNVGAHLIAGYIHGAVSYEHMVTVCQEIGIHQNINPDHPLHKKYGGLPNKPKIKTEKSQISRVPIFTPDGKISTEAEKLFLSTWFTPNKDLFYSPLKKQSLSLPELDRYITVVSNNGEDTVFPINICRYFNLDKVYIFPSKAINKLLIESQADPLTCVLPLYHAGVSANSNEALLALNLNRRLVQTTFPVMAYQEFSPPPKLMVSAHANNCGAAFVGIHDYSHVSAQNDYRSLHRSSELDLDVLLGNPESSLKMPISDQEATVIITRSLLSLDESKTNTDLKDIINTLLDEPWLKELPQSLVTFLNQNPSIKTRFEIEARKLYTQLQKSKLD